MSFRNLSYRTAFTLVELLVAMVIAGILSSMVAIALQGAQRQAQDTRAKSLIDRLNITLLQLYEQETYARVALPAGAESTTTRSLSELMWRRDWLRCAFPDRREDIAENPVRVPYPLVPLSTWLFIDDGVPPRPANPTLPVVVPGITSGVTATSRRAQQLLRFRQRIARTIQAAEASKGNAITVTNFTQFVDGSEANGEWTAEHQSAECLYLILSTNMVNGVPASDSLRTRDVGDIDEDGMPEVLDAWGVPVGYMRWPVGLTLTPDWNQPNPDPASTAARPAWAWLHSRKTLLGPDPLDTLSSDPRYFDNSDTSLDNPRAEDPFPLVPLIVSAGQDGEFDLFGLDSVAGALPVIDYADHGNNWPDQSGSLVLRDPSRPSTSPPMGYPPLVTFVDPYLDSQPISQKLGARVDNNDDRTDQSADNIYPTLPIL